MKIDALTVKTWHMKACNWCLAYHPELIPGLVKTGSDAWAIASRCGILEEAYRDRDIVDAHIQTALQKIFPNAVFKDAKRY